MTDESQSVPEGDREMSFLDHIAELRTRLLWSLGAIIPAVVVSWFFKWQIFEFLIAPLKLAWQNLDFEGGGVLHTLGPTDAFMMHLKNSLVAGILLAAPWIFWQAWGFISPGLYRRERLLAIPFIVISTFCFVGGAMFGYVFVFDEAFRLLLEFNGELLVPQIVVSEYMPFFRRMLIAFGVVFEVPVVVTFLAWAGIVDWRQLLRFSRWWVVVASFLSMILTPQDVYSMFMMLVPLIVLYYVGVGGAFAVSFINKKKEPA